MRKIGGVGPTPRENDPSYDNAEESEWLNDHLKNSGSATDNAEESGWSSDDQSPHAHGRAPHLGGRRRPGTTSRNAKTGTASTCRCTCASVPLDTDDSIEVPPSLLLPEE